MAHLLKTASLAIAATGLTLSMPASAAVPAHAAPQSHAHAASIAGDMTYEHSKKRKHWKRHHHDRYDDYRGSYREARPYYMGYDRDYGQPVYRDTRVWRGRDGRYYCERENGTTGLLVGAGVGVLIGHEVAGRGDRTLGAILGGAAGALLGRTIDRSNTRCG
ncbi:glycine zipper 2TM domain-containing protein [Qipengyuania gaetbuli]|uniref:glycine zipper 2TM domain-containing protein n=1 Tax=Qipengyuania gaetbuli TaxID=266952 RepID=UPI001CD3C0F4|nr:glycine zipper 2TM domain-containing protein [Qipengyuania gaetbuli]MCA0909314.1 glycine zipper 2TM domain-containing protein [Qipengyuania gaetbuli]